MSEVPAPPHPSLERILDRVNVGVFIVNRDYDIVLWNDFMAVHSGQAAEDILGRNLFEAFPELPERWVKQKLRSVFLLKTPAFTSWEQRPYLFKFPHNRPITGGVESMRQNCTFQPVEDETGQVAFVCITVFDTTDASIYQEQLHETKQRLEELSVRDGLTGLYNRRHLEDCLSAEFVRVYRHGGTLSFLLLDIDHFKPINDTYGHQAGDEALIHLAALIRETLRESDMCGRYGGEEFALLLPETDLDGALEVGERLRRQIADTPCHYKDMTLPFTVSIGVATVTPQCSGPESLTKEADLALYRAKDTGRNQVLAYDPAIDG